MVFLLMLECASGKSVAKHGGGVGAGTRVSAGKGTSVTLSTIKIIFKKERGKPSAALGAVGQQ